MGGWKFLTISLPCSFIIFDSTFWGRVSLFSSGEVYEGFFKGEAAFDKLESLLIGLSGTGGGIGRFKFSFRGLFFGSLGRILSFFGVGELPNPAVEEFSNLGVLSVGMYS